MAEPIRGRLTGFTNAMSRHGARVVEHTDDTLAQFKATRVSRDPGNAEYVIVDAVKVYKQCERDAMDLAIHKKAVPEWMQYEYGKPFCPPASAAPAAVAKVAAANAEIDALIASVVTRATTTGMPPTAEEVEAMVTGKSLRPAGAEAVTAVVDEIKDRLDAQGAAQNQALAQRCAELQAQNAALATKLKDVAAELNAAKALAPILAENAVSVEIAGFGSIDLTVDYLWQQGNILVLGTLKSKKRAQAIPKPSGDTIKVVFVATIQNKHYELTAFADFRFPVGDLDVQAFLITKQIGE